MSDYQKVVLVGNATQDAEAKRARDTDVTYTSFRVGVKDVKGKSSYFPIVVFGRSQKSVAEFVKKGRRVLVEGRIDVGQTGRASVVADRVVFLDAPPDETPAKEKLRKTARKLRAKKANPR